LIRGFPVNYLTLDDEALLRLIAHAHTEALSVLYDRYNRLVFSIALNAIGDREIAEEITQDVFFRIWEKAYTYRAEQAKVSTWLASITRNRAIDVLRQLSTRPEYNSVAWGEIPPKAEPSVNGLEGSVELALEQKRVRVAIASLPREQQEALALAYFQGLSHIEIADKLGEPLGTVKTRIRLAMQKLRRLLREDNLSD
jgi:RNA polymerase sigma-70 factor, ECF subfamily